jgi:hypothetical protein
MQLAHGVVVKRRSVPASNDRAVNISTTVVQCCNGALGGRDGLYTLGQLQLCVRCVVLCCIAAADHQNINCHW